MINMFSRSWSTGQYFRAFSHGVCTVRLLTYCFTQVSEITQPFQLFDRLLTPERTESRSALSSRPEIR